MTIDSEQFLEDFPEFSDTTLYPTSTITFWIKWAYLFLNESRFCDAMDLAVELYTAHNMVFAAQANQAAANGIPVGTDLGIVNNKSVDKVSVGYDVNAAANEGAGHWNLTTYGNRLWMLIQMFGAGPIQVGAGCCFDFFNVAAFAGPAWPGPLFNGSIPNPSQ